MNAIFRTLMVLFVLSGLVLVVFWRLSVDQAQKTIAELAKLNDQMQAQIEQREAMVQRLSRSRRIAHLDVLDQQTDESGKVTHTTVQFIELDDEGTELARQLFTLPGDVLFVDALTVKFDPERVAEGHPLLGRTLVLLRRMYTDRMSPADGVAIDTPGAVPPGYAAAETGKFEQQLWENFWKIATDAATARSMGVRVAQGEAVYKPVKVGQAYELVVDAVGGMSLSPLAPDESAITKAGT
jgi:hypothetical protein